MNIIRRCGSRSTGICAFQPARVFAEAPSVPTWLLTLPEADQARQQALRHAEVEVITVDPDPLGQIDLASALATLGQRGLTRLLVEGGGRLAAALLRAGLVDRLVWLHAPSLLGGDGLPAVGALGLTALAEAPRFDRLSAETVGADLLSVYRACRE